MAESCTEGLTRVIEQIFGMGQDVGLDADDAVLFQKARAEADEWIRRIKRDEEVERLLTEESDIGPKKIIQIIDLYTKTFTQKGTGATCTVPAFEVDSTN